jgi:hypothetical protein
MALDDFSYSPPTGWLDETEFPDYPTAPEVRPMFQRLFDQIRDAFNTHKAEDATTLQKGHVQLGTTAGTAAEGDHNHDNAYTPKPALNAVSVSTTLALTDAEDVLNCTNAAAITITIPTNATVAFPVGTEIAVIRQGAGTIAIAPAGGVTLSSDGGKRSIKNQYTSVALKKIATDTWVLVGSLSA